MSISLRSTIIIGTGRGVLQLLGNGLLLLLLSYNLSQVLKPLNAFILKAHTST